MMKTIFSCALLALFYFSGVESHTMLTKIKINGQDYTNCLRPTYPGNLYSSTNMGADFPISSSNFLSSGVTSSNYTCGFLPYAGRPASGKCAVAAGSTIGVYYYHGGNFGNEDPVLDKYIARSHKGPFMAFLARSDTGSGNVWFKIHQEGKIRESSSSWDQVQWSSPDTLLANSGYQNFRIPSDIAPGNYLLRTEIIALHDTSYRGAQPYVTCIELSISGSGSANPPGVAIPGNWDYTHPGMTYNMYNDYRKAYPFPGPAVYVAGSATTGPATTGPATTGPATTGPATTGPATTGPATTGRATTGPATTGPATTGPATTGPYTTTGVYTTTGQAVPRVTAKVTVKINVDPSKLDTNYFVYEVTQVLGIPSSAILSVSVDVDKSTSTSTVIEFILWNDVKADGTRVDPVSAAVRLRTMAVNNDPQIQGTSYLIGMEVLDTSAAPAPDSTQQADSSSGGGVATTTIIIAAVVVGVVVLAAIAAASFFIIRKRRNNGWI